MDKHILSVGDLVIDLMLPVSLPIEAEKHQVAADRYLEPGGGCNFILCAKYLGAIVSAVGAVGNDMFGQELLQILNEKGVNTTPVQIMPNTTTTLVLSLSDSARNQHVFVGNYGSGQPVTPPSELPTMIEQTDCVFALGYAFVESRTTRLANNVLVRAKQHNKPIYFDVGPLFGQLDSLHIRAIISMVDVVFATESELPLITEGKQGEAAYQHLFDLGISTLIIKQGDEGCLVVQPDNAFFSSAYPVDNVVDTIGAGDCFAAGFIWAHLHGLPLADCAAIANAAGAASVQKVGAGRNVPTLDEIQAVLDVVGDSVTIPSAG